MEQGYIKRLTANKAYNFLSKISVRTIYVDISENYGSLTLDKVRYCSEREKMKKNITEILKEYLEYYKNERERQSKLIEYLEKNDDNQITDWNNFNGHVVASGIIYSNKTSKFLVMYHKDMRKYIYSGGHIDKEDKSPLETAIREIKEETGINNFKLVKVTNNELLPFDIDTQVINYNKRLNLPQHVHFDFRYLFEVDDISNVEIDNEEMSNYKWIEKEKFYDDFKEMSNKIEHILKNR